MRNPYAPPSSDVELKELQSPRPFGIKLLAVLFIVLSAAMTFEAYLDDDSGIWLLVLACSLLLIILLRGVFLGREKDRETGVFLGFLIVVLNAWAIYDASMLGIRPQDFLYVAEGVYGLAAAFYLIKMRASSFFK